MLKEDTENGVGGGENGTGNGSHKGPEEGKRMEKGSASPEISKEEDREESESKESKELDLKKKDDGVAAKRNYRSNKGETSESEKEDRRPGSRDRRQEVAVQRFYQFLR